MDALRLKTDVCARAEMLLRYVEDDCDGDDLITTLWRAAKRLFSEGLGPEDDYEAVEIAYCYATGERIFA